MPNPDIATLQDQFSTFDGAVWADDLTAATRSIVSGDLRFTATGASTLGSIKSIGSYNTLPGAGSGLTTNTYVRTKRSGSGGAFQVELQNTNGATSVLVYCVGANLTAQTEAGSVSVTYDPVAMAWLAIAVTETSVAIRYAADAGGSPDPTWTAITSKLHATELPTWTPSSVRVVLLGGSSGGSAGDWGAFDAINAAAGNGPSIALLRRRLLLAR